MNAPARSETWGFIGLGLLGSAMARRLLQTGVRVSGFDIDPRRVTEFTEAGGSVQHSLSEVVAQQTLISLCLPDGAAVKQIVDQAGDRWQQGCVVLDHSTISPQDSEDIALALSRRQVTYLEATVAGSSRDAQDGQALLLCAGDEAEYRRVEPQLKLLAEQVFYLGATGSAARMKLLFNHVLGLHRAVLAEALGLAAKQGMDLEQVLNVLTAGAPQLDVTRNKGPKMIQGDYTPHARLRQHHKDVRLILEWAAQVSAFLPLEQLHERLLEQAVESGLGDDDNSAVFELFCRPREDG